MGLEVDVYDQNRWMKWAATWRMGGDSCEVRRDMGGLL